MKVFIVTLAVVILYTFTIVFNQDYRQAQRATIGVKYVCEELSATGSLFYDVEQFGDGLTVYNTEQSMVAIRDQITHLISFDSVRNPIPGSYWTDQMNYIVYFYDDLLERKIYINGDLSSSEDFTYPYSHLDLWTNYNYIVNDPVVIVTINAGIPKYRYPFLNEIPDIVRSSSHVLDDRQ